jgi:hypoxanthine phosphoribosyltransferase
VTLAEYELGKTLFTEEQIQTRVRELAEQINQDYRDSSCFLIGILKGAFIFMADLVRHVEVPVEFDFIACSSYGSATKTSGIVRIIKDLDADIKDRNVLLVEDIIDTGLTLNYLLRNFRSRGPASLEICSLLNKRTENKVELPIKYEGFSIPDVFVVGYGLDYAERYRNLPYIAELKK